MLTRIISGAVGVVLLGIVLCFHSTIVLPIAVAAIIVVVKVDESLLISEIPLSKFYIHDLSMF